MILFYMHEKVWFKSNVKSAHKRHILKTFTWRFIATLDTVLLSTLIVGDAIIDSKLDLQS